MSRDTYDVMPNDTAASRFGELMSRLKTIVLLPRRKKLLVAEATAELILAWALVRQFNFSKYSLRLGKPHPGEYIVDLDADEEVLRDIRWAIKTINRALDRRYTCLMMAMAGKAMLNRRGVSNSLVLGAKIEPHAGIGNGENMAAHAWLSVGQLILLGGEERQGYLPVTSYYSN